MQPACSILGLDITAVESSIFCPLAHDKELPHSKRRGAQPMADLKHRFRSSQCLACGREREFAMGSNGLAFRAVPVDW